MMQEDTPVADRRWAGQIVIKIDVAACIRNGLLGLAALILALASLLAPDHGPSPVVAQAISSFLGQ